MSPTMPRSVRVPDDLWHAAVTAAQGRGETVTAIVIKALETYVKKNGA